MGAHKKIEKMQVEIDSLHKITLDVVGLIGKQTEIITTLRETNTTITTQIEEIKKQIPIMANNTQPDLIGYQ